MDNTNPTSLSTVHCTLSTLRMLRFAVPGSPLSTPKPGGTVAGLQYIHSLGLNAMELEWVQRVPLNPEHMALIGATAKELDIMLTVHAPYYINLNSPEPEKLVASKKRILDALWMAQIAGIVSVCVHAAFNLGCDEATVLENVRRAVDDILKHKQKLFPDVNLGLETMGKQSQFGTLEEVLKISREFDLYPVIDPAHLHARSNGAVNSTEEWHEMFDVYEEYLGKKSLQKMHLHFSGIAYGPKGEKHHLELRESDAKWEEFVKVLKERAIGGVCVCESPAMEKDTALMKGVYDGL
jgi:deoxyribonuclease IV